MRSKAHLKSHPLHPILIPFPIAFFTGAFFFDLLLTLTDKASFQQTAEYLLLAGIITTVMAAIPGVIDYIYSVPPQSSGKKRATKHALINVAHLLLFTVVYILRLQNESFSGILIVGLEAVGIALMMVAGWMGATLVHRNQIGVDHRFASAGKWNEAYFEQGTGSVAVADSDELKRDQMKLLHLQDRRIVLARTEAGYVAFDDRCTHRGASLADGVMICGTVQCPWHGSQFDVNNGQVKAGPANETIKTYLVKEANGKVFLEVH